MTGDVQVQSIPHLDVERYLGRWYEIGRLPLKWEPTGASNVTATYSMNDDGTIRVDNRCFDDKNEPTQSIGRAKQAGEKTSELTVSFLPEFLRWIPFTEGDYWVLKLDDGYEHALVGTPDHTNLWLLARTPHVDADVLREYLDAAEDMGFDLTAWITPTQTGRTVTDALLG